MCFKQIRRWAAASSIVVLGLVAGAGTSFADFVVSSSHAVVVSDDVNNTITTILSASTAGPADGVAAGPPGNGCGNGGAGVT